MCLVTYTKYSCGHSAGHTVERCGKKSCIKTSTTDYLNYVCESCCGCDSLEAAVQPQSGFMKDVISGEGMARSDTVDSDTE